MKISKTALLLVGISFFPSMVFAVEPVICPDSGPNTESINMTLSAAGGFQSRPMAYDSTLVFQEGELMGTQFNCKYTDSSGKELWLGTKLSSTKCKLSGEKNNTASCE